ncbi:MAG TPA: thioesterase family protein [Gaiellaceae bacterium]|jgi:acyl-CoA thioester hydrolase|nr:thioesterase family protein [Gaiellaceae bacterium]
MHEKRIEIRWRDLDAAGHVNNAVFLTYLEEARDEWLDRTLGETWDYLLARVAVDYRRELRLEDDEVLARCGVARIGTSSVTTREELLTAAGELAAEAEAVVVARDPASGRARPLSAEERAALAREA